MINKFTRPIDTGIVQNKLDQLSSVLKESFANKDLATMEDLVVEANQILASYYTDIRGPLFNPVPVLPGALPDPRDYNGDLEAINKDLTVLFQELENLEGLVLRNFDFFVSESNRLSGKVKSVSSKLGDYILFASNPVKDLLFFGDSYNNLDNIEVDSGFYKEPICEVNQSEGIVTLPATRSAESKIPLNITPIINTNSNGVAGNNQEIGALLNDDVRDILDGNPDTWFEYERVVSQDADTGEPLILDMRLELDSERILNFVRINPNNFGTRSSVEILDISTSADGETFISIKDEIPVPGFQTADEPNIFVLAPSTSKYAGQGLYTFTPRRARYIHLVLRQSTPYSIQTIFGSKNRYAIGIRDVEASAIQYEPTGEIVSVEFEAPEEVRKIALISGQSPSEESELVSIEHSISPDNGDTWVPIRPKAFTGQSGTVNEVPEVLTFNSHLEDSVETQSGEPVLKFRYKATMRRNAEAFKEGASSLKKNVKFKTELHQIPATTPFSLPLEKPPVTGSVRLVDPHFGSRGDAHRYAVAISNESAQTYKLPWQNIPAIKTKVEQSPGVWTTDHTNAVRVFVDGDQWSTGNLSTGNANSRIQSIDQNKGLLKFGNGINGRSPDRGSIISLSLEPERLLTTPVEGGHKAKLEFPTNGDKKSVVIERLSPAKEHAEPLDRLTKIHRLEQQNLISGTLLFRPAGAPFSDLKTYVDGKVELLDAGDYSVDYESGIIYSYTATGAVAEVSVSYKYNPSEILTEADWDFEEGQGLKDELVIYDRAWATTPVARENIPSAVRKFSFSKFNIEPGTLVFSEATVFAREVPFIDGRQEVLGLIKASEVVPPFTSWTSVGGDRYTFKTSLIPADTTNHPLAFSNSTLFANQVADPPVTNGEYSVDIVNREIKVFANPAPSTTSLGSMSYLYQDPTKVLAGVYSVDYKNGDVYTHDNTPVGAWAKFEYSDLEINYPIARVIPSTDYEVDADNLKINISDREILRKTQIPTVPAATGGTGNTYQVLYNYVQETRSGVEELEPYFTPILKEYALKVLTKSKIF